MIDFVAALALQPPMTAPPPSGYVVPPDLPAMPEALGMSLDDGVRLIRVTCWKHLRDPERLMAAAIENGFNFHWVGSRRERIGGSGAGTINYQDAGLLNPRGSDRECDLFLRIEPRDHARLAAALAVALRLPQGATRPIPPRAYVPPSDETNWEVRSRDGAILRVKLVTRATRRGGNAHFFVTRYPAAPLPRRRNRR